MEQLIDRIELAYTDLIADLAIGNNSRLLSHANKFETLKGEVDIQIATADPDGIMDLLVPEGFEKLAVIGYNLDLISKGIRGGGVTPA